MTSSENSERRRASREDLSVYYPTVFEHRGSEVRALLINLSQTGGKFQLQYVQQDLDLQKGDRLDLEIRTDLGILGISGVVTWHRKKETYTTWGVAFEKTTGEHRTFIKKLLEGPGYT